jgi:hypothetical protein
MMETRYKALRLIATLMKITGIFIAVLSVFGALSLCGAVTSGGVAFERMLREFGQNSSGLGAFAGLMGGLFAGVVPVVIGGSFALIMYAGGEAVNLQIAIEENTRSMVWYLQHPTQTAPATYAQMQPGGGGQSTSAVISPISLGRYFNLLPRQDLKDAFVHSAARKLSQQMSNVQIAGMRWFNKKEIL